MGINLVIAVTDGDWFEKLRRQPDLGEVNFWAPSAANFRALQPGELFLFKLRAPHNVIVGGGIFTYANTLPCSLVWEAFGEANGARIGAGNAGAHHQASPSIAGQTQTIAAIFPSAAAS